MFNVMLVCIKMAFSHIRDDVLYQASKKTGFTDVVGLAIPNTPTTYSSVIIYSSNVHGYNAHGGTAQVHIQMLLTVVT